MKIPKLTIEQICKFELAVEVLCDQYGLQLEHTGTMALSRLIGKDDGGLFVRYGFIVREK